MAQLRRAWTLWHSCVGWGPYGTAMGDVARTAQPHWTGTAWHSYGAVTRGDSRRGVGAEPGSRDAPAAPTGAGPHSGWEGPTQLGHTVLPALPPQAAADFPVLFPSAGGLRPHVPQLLALRLSRVSPGTSPLEIPPVASQGPRGGFRASLTNCSRGGQAPSSVLMAHAGLYGVFPIPLPPWLPVDATHPTVPGGHRSHPRLPRCCHLSRGRNSGAFDTS